MMILFNNSSHDIGKMACLRATHLFNKDPGPIGDLMLSCLAEKMAMLKA